MGLGADARSAAVVLLAGIAVFSGNVLARTIGVIGATISALSSFVAIGLYPVWAICIIAVDIAVIWALTAHGRDIQKFGEMGLRDDDDTSVVTR